METKTMQVLEADEPGQFYLIRNEGTLGAAFEWETVSCEGPSYDYLATDASIRSQRRL